MAGEGVAVSAGIEMEFVGRVKSGVPVAVNNPVGTEAAAAGVEISLAAWRADMAFGAV